MDFSQSQSSDAKFNYFLLQGKKTFMHSLNDENEKMIIQPSGLWPF